MAKKTTLYDVAIIGGGPAGLTAGIYAHRYKLKSIVVSDSIGGMANEAHMVDNYPGFPEISGYELMEKWKSHAEKLGVEILQSKVSEIKKEKDGFTIYTSSEKVLSAKAVILALGTMKRKLSIPGEEKYIGKGVSYCYTCDGPFFSGKAVAVVGNSNSAALASLLLAEHAKSVSMVFAEKALSADPSKIELVTSNPKIKLYPSSKIAEIKGDKFVSLIALDNGKNIPAEGVFVELESIPSSVLSRKLGIKLDKDDFIIVDSHQATNIKGVYAAGDITAGAEGLKQIITAAATGAKAAHSVFKFLK
jgi:thioredoxin reductase (NADPH)